MKNYSASAVEVAEHFDVSATAVRLWVRKGCIPPETYIRLPRLTKFDINALEAFFTRHQNQSENVVAESDQDDLDFKTRESSNSFETDSE